MSDNEDIVIDSNSDHDLWEKSPSPSENFDDALGANEDGEWPCAVVGQEVGFQGKKLYNIRWENWQREDGTANTWEDTSHDTSRSILEKIKTWEQTNKRRRNKAAREDDAAIEISSSDNTLATPTFLLYQAYEEKEKSLKRRDSMEDLPARMLRQRQEIENPPGRLRRSGTMDSTPRLNHRKSMPSIGQPIAGSSRTLSAPSNVSTPRRRREDSVLSTPSTAATLVSQTTHPFIIYYPKLTEFSRSLSKHERCIALSTTDRKELKRKVETTTVTTPRKREKFRAHPDLSNIWSRAAQISDAAIVRFVNDVDDEEYPSGLSDDFQYLERSYTYNDNIPESVQNTPEWVFESCKCHDVCSPGKGCTCQADRVYTSKGSLKFRDGLPVASYIVECNDYCECEHFMCHNRIAQLPRTIPIEVFKTGRASCGWGVRPSSTVSKGRVIGLYTGKLITRKAAEKMNQAQRCYVFDLDKLEGNLLPFQKDLKYSIDATHCGNWSRFLNHSCDPNLVVIGVQWDTVRDHNVYYLAFVAQRDIPAGEELTFDYSPPSDHDDGSSDNQDDNSNIEIQEQVCMCGAHNCRGFISTG